MLIVDLCGTLVRENTTHGFLRALDRPQASWQRQALLSRPGLALGDLFPGLGHRARLVGCLRGMERAELQRQAGRYAQAALQRAGRHELIARVRASPSVVLASASLDVVVEAFAAALGIPRWVATELDYDAGVCLGTIRRDATGRKRELVEQLVGAPLSGHLVVTDNPEDEDLRRDAAAFEFLHAPPA